VTNQNQNDSASQRERSGSTDNQSDRMSGSNKPGQQSQGGSQRKQNDNPQQSGGTDKARQQSQGGPNGNSGSRQGGPGNFANDPERASEAGRKGGEKSHDGHNR
jgi:uncharacterized protein